MTPAGVAALRRAGHEVVIERGAGVGSAFGDGDYVASGTTAPPERAGSFETRPGVRHELATPANLAAHLPSVDLLVGAVLQAGARTPHVVTEAMVSQSLCVRPRWRELPP